MVVSSRPFASFYSRHQVGIMFHKPVVSLLIVVALSLSRRVMAQTPIVAPSACPKGTGIAAPPQEDLASVQTATVDVPSHPFGVVYATQQEDTAFVAAGETLTVLDTSALTPTLKYQVPLSWSQTSYAAAGISITHDGRYILATVESDDSSAPSALILDAAKAASGGDGSVVGVLQGKPVAGKGAIEVTITSDDSFAFVSLEYGSSSNQGSIEVFQLSLNNDGSMEGTYVGYLPLGNAVVGTALSPNGETLYATSEGKVSGQPGGTVNVISVAILKTHPQKALTATFDAGCNPVRTIVSQDGSTVWVTARESNALFAFDATQLSANSTNTVIASIEVGTSPVGLTFVNNESRILVANSNRFNVPGATTGITVVDVAAALYGGQAVLGQVSTGLFPREFALSPDNNTVLVSDYGSNEVQAIDVNSLP